jgi:hypothetical protein
MRTWLETGAQPEYHHLCASILALARTATARLLGRETDVASPVTRPRQSESRFVERAADLRTAWAGAEQVVPGGGPLGRLSRLLRTSASFVEPVLLALAAAPLLDRSTARSYGRLDREPMTAGLLLDLASATEASRMALFAALHPDAPLRRNGLLLAGDDGAASAITPIAVAPAVLAVLRCEPVPLPRGIDELPPLPDPGEATRTLDALGIPLLRAGELVAMVRGRAAAQTKGSNGTATPGDAGAGATPDAARDAKTDANVDALARLLAGADSSLVWHLRLDDHPDPDWLALLRDAALANATCLVTARGSGAWLRRLQWVTDRTLRSAICVLPADHAPSNLRSIDMAAVCERLPPSPSSDLKGNLDITSAADCARSSQHVLSSR